MLVPPVINGGGSNSAGSAGSGRRHGRLLSLNTVSWPNPNELTVSPRQRRMSTVTSSEAQVKFYMNYIIEVDSQYKISISVLRMMMTNHLYRRE